MSWGPQLTGETLSLINTANALTLLCKEAPEPQGPSTAGRMQKRCFSGSCNDSMSSRGHGRGER